MTRTRVALVGAALTVAVGVPGLALTAPTVATAKKKPKPQKVVVRATEYHFALTKRVVKRGVVSFTVLNQGSEVHDFKVNGKVPKSRFLAAGTRQTIKIRFTKPGRYQYLCTIGEHAVRGMQGVLIVKK
jgi:plastocyanin